MKILIAGASGYVGTRLMNLLAESGHQIVAFVRSAKRLHILEHLLPKIEVIEGDLLDDFVIDIFPKDIDAAYFLVHSMGVLAHGFSDLERLLAENFTKAIAKTQAKQVIYLSGLAKKGKMSEHMMSRHRVEDILKKGDVPVTILRAGVIVGSGSASFEVMRDLVEKLPLMVAPRWVFSKCQPIGITDILYYLEAVLGKSNCFAKTFEVGGPDILTYRQMLLEFAKTRGLKRMIIPVPFLTPYLSSLWLFFVTTVNFSIAQAIVESLTTDAVCSENSIEKLIPRKCLSFVDTVRLAFDKIEQNAVISSWKDAMVQSRLHPQLVEYIHVPEYGCYKDFQRSLFSQRKSDVIERLWKIGGNTGWYTMNWAWQLRGLADKLFGGVGLRRGRTHEAALKTGDVLDFWRVLIADKEKGYLLLYAEMKLPGEAWLEWKIEGDKKGGKIEQKATFRPKGVLGRVYWYILLPIHKIIFRRLCNSIGNVS